MHWVCAELRQNMLKCSDGRIIPQIACTVLLRAYCGARVLIIYNFLLAGPTGERQHRRQTTSVGAGDIRPDDALIAVCMFVDRGDMGGKALDGQCARHSSHALGGKRHAKGFPKGWKWGIGCLYGSGDLDWTYKPPSHILNLPHSLPSGARFKAL